MKKIPNFRIPVAPPGKVMKSARDYDRKMQAKFIARDFSESIIEETNK
ncbi:MAG: hypothetical protein OEL57_16335 [Trichlorobacter sp.]|nr:hypothetical protein [Trichlorobacter sp.]MDK9719451.1 hypothetical protein [Trichlorobacter sp.]